MAAKLVLALSQALAVTLPHPIFPSVRAAVGRLAIGDTDPPSQSFLLCVPAHQPTATAWGRRAEEMNGAPRSSSHTHEPSLEGGMAADLGGGAGAGRGGGGGGRLEGRSGAGV